MKGPVLFSESFCFSIFLSTPIRYLGYATEARPRPSLTSCAALFYVPFFGIVGLAARTSITANSVALYRDLKSDVINTQAR